MNRLWGIDRTVNKHQTKCLTNKKGQRGFKVESIVNECMNNKEKYKKVEYSPTKDEHLNSYFVNKRVYVQNCINNRVYLEGSHSNRVSLDDHSHNHNKLHL